MNDDDPATPRDEAPVDWFRLYNDIIDDPKIIRLSPENRWFYVGLLCVSSKETVRGNLPSAEFVAISLRVRVSKARSLLTMFKKAGLIDEDPTTKTLTIHGWDARQRKSDDAAARMSRLRSERKPAGCSEHVRPKSEPRVRATETETETETERPPTPTGGGPADVEPFQADPIEPTATLDPAASRVMDQCGRRWGSQGADISADLLSTFAPAVVAYAADEAFNKFGRRLSPGAAAYIRRVCQNNRDGPPDPGPARAPARPPAPLKYTVCHDPDDLIPPALRGKKHA